MAAGQILDPYQPYTLEVRGSTLKVRGWGMNSEPRFGWFEVRLLKIREVQGSEISGSFKSSLSYL